MLAPDLYEGEELIQPGSYFDLRRDDEREGREKTTFIQKEKNNNWTGVEKRGARERERRKESGDKRRGGVENQKLVHERKGRPGVHLNGHRTTHRDERKDKKR